MDVNNGVPDEGSSVDGTIPSQAASTMDDEMDQSEDRTETENLGDSSREYEDALSIPEPKQEVEGIDLEKIEAEVQDELMTSQEVTVQHNTPPCNDGDSEDEDETEIEQEVNGEHELSGQGDFEDALSDIDDKDKKSSVEVNGYQQDENSDDSDDNIGSVSDDENEVISGNHDLDKDDANGLQLHMKPRSVKPSSTSTDELLTGFVDDGHSSVISDIFTDVGARLGKYSKSTPSLSQPHYKSKAPEPSSYDSLRSQYTRPSAHQNLEPSKGRSLKPNYEHYIHHITSNPLGYYLDEEEQNVSSMTTMTCFILSCHKGNFFMNYDN